VRKSSIAGDVVSYAYITSFIIVGVGLTTRRTSTMHTFACPYKGGGYNCDSTSIRRPFDGLSKVTEITVTYRNTGR